MANFSALKTAIQNAIKQNGNEEITGDVLQQILLSIVSTMGDGSINTIEQNLSQETLARQNGDNTLQSNINAEALARGNADTQLQNAINAIKANIDNGYVYAGIATPSSTPVSGKVFYIATSAGTYTNFGGQVLTQGINILRYNGSAWSSQQLIGIDDAPTAGSNSLVKSGGVQNELALGAVYDVSAKNPTAGPNNDGKFTLEYILDQNNVNTLIPAAYRKGGMSIKFVQSSDNKYVQCRLMSDEWSIDTKDWAIAEEGVYVENPEFVYVKTDREGKILWAIKTDGDIYYGAGVPQQVKDYIEEKISSLSLDEYEDMVSFLSDYLGSDTTLKAMIDGINAQIATKLDAEGLDADALGTVQVVENPEFIEAKTDSEGKLLAGRTSDGAVFENVGISTPKVSIDGHTIENIEDPEGRSEVTTDSENKVISYRDAAGVKHENLGIKTPHIEVDEIGFSSDAYKRTFEAMLKEDMGIIDIDIPHLPKYGTVNIKQETFYLTYNADITDHNDVYVIQDYADTDVNARAKITLSYYYLKSSLINNGDGTYSKYGDGVEGHDVKLTFYAATLVTEVSGIPYVTSTLTDNGDGTYSVNPTSVRVVEITDVPDVKTWPVDKKTKHHCLVDIDFGYFLSYSDKPTMVSFQGSSTLEYRERNFRFTFYKNATFAKKEKVKIGEMIRQSSYNLKANWTDVSKLKELILNRLILAVWKQRDVYDQYPWFEEHTPYCGATGTIKGFPVRVSIGGAFYGIDIFGLKKDEGNYMLHKAEMDGETFVDADGLFVSGNGGVYEDGYFRDSWGVHPEFWEDEMNDDEFLTEILPDAQIDVKHTQADYDALISWLTFINSADFTRENIPTRMDLVGWFDYFILMQVFIMYDNTSRNLVLYANAERTKFYPFFYDLDLAWNITGRPVDSDILVPGVSFSADMSLWQNFYDIYKDEIINRYCQLRNSVLSEKYVRAIYDYAVQSIPEADIQAQRTRWGQTVKTDDMSSFFDWLITRLNWLDNNYFKV